MAKKMKVSKTALHNAIIKYQDENVFLSRKESDQPRLTTSRELCVYAVYALCVRQLLTLKLPWVPLKNARLSLSWFVHAECVVATIMRCVTFSGIPWTPTRALSLASLELSDDSAPDRAQGIGKAAWLMQCFYFINHVPLPIIFIVWNFVQRRFCVPRSVIYTFSYAHYMYWRGCIPFRKQATKLWRTSYRYSGTEIIINW